MEVESAFPGQELNQQYGAEQARRGMSLLDYFAGQALAGLCSNPEIDFDHGLDGIHEVYASHSYKLAKAMLAERSKESQ